ncbi:hypothetical protein SAMN05428974_1860 [Sphingopyxis sp. YR583]|uniref:hypothetical protein n=1 Tax=Sphingopyxis sp. YR583 TaxID=1881047 RepID=UPI0008A8020C|nr:hypothetical protein [Sphingopyxis sp. YR583]SEH16739.1 hypothetical protein SAMN05428974_1860 [Sphingopyxis sp. YR583]
MEKILLSVISALIGFALSQSFNLISYLRRPKFRVKLWSDGVLSSYTGDPPETPWEIELGFYLENYGKNPAKNIRIFVSDMKGSGKSDEDLELTSIELLELKRPIDLVPSSECVEVKLGTISSDRCTLALNLHSAPDEKALDFIAADTRGKIRFSAKFYVSCDEKNSFKSFILDFRPDKNDWASALLEDYTEEHLTSVTWPKF